MANYNHWANPNNEPKRSHNWVLTMSGDDVAVIEPAFLVSANKPKGKISVTEHQFLNHTFKFPGRMAWDPITVVLIDSITDGGLMDLSSRLLGVMQESGYMYPDSQEDTANGLTVISKRDAVKALGAVTIKYLQDGVGISEWELMNAWIADYDFGDLDYGNEDLVKISLTLQFDWPVKLDI